MFTHTFVAHITVCSILCVKCVWRDEIVDGLSDGGGASIINAEGHVDEWFMFDLFLVAAGACTRATVAIAWNSVWTTFE